MALFKSEREMNEYFDARMYDLTEKCQMEASDRIAMIDLCRTMMAEYSRLLSEGKIKRPYTYSADKPSDFIAKSLHREVK